MENRYKELRLGIRIDGSPMSQAAFAKKVGIAPPHVCSIESGRPASLSEMKKYHDYFGVSYEYLLGETDNPSVIDETEKPLVRDAELNLRYLRKSDSKTCQRLHNAACDILDSNRGLALLYYAEKLMKGQITEEEMAHIIKSSADPRFDNIVDCQVKLTHFFV